MLSTINKMALRERVKRKLPPKENQYGLIYFPDEETYSVVSCSKIHDFEDDENSNFIIIENKSYDIEVIVRGSKDYCEKKANEFKNMATYYNGVRTALDPIRAICAISFFDLNNFFFYYKFDLNN